MLSPGVLKMFGIVRTPTSPHKPTRRREPPPSRYTAPRYLALRIQDLSGFDLVRRHPHFYRWPAPVPDAVPAHSDPILAARQMEPNEQLVVLYGEKALERNRFTPIDRENLNLLCSHGFRAARVVAGRPAIEAVLERHARRVFPNCGAPTHFDWAFALEAGTARAAAEECTRSTARFFGEAAAGTFGRCLTRRQARAAGRALLEDLHATVRAAPPGPDWMLTPLLAGAITLHCTPVESVLMDFTEMTKTWAPPPGPLDSIHRTFLMSAGYWTLRLNYENRVPFLAIALELIADMSIPRSRVRYVAQARSNDRVFDLLEPGRFWTYGT